ncbi:MAG: serine/threonine-protein kinase, partial [Jatrophihabitans sp.]
MKDASQARGAWRAGGYVAEELIGHGGSADVWRGRQVRSGEPVALKRIAMRGDRAVHSARAEAAVLAGLSHPHLIAFRELVPAGGAIVLVLELAAGGSLGALIDRRRFLAPGEVVTALAPICAALAYAHTEGLVHSDVSAGNVLFTADGKPLLADLGVSRLLGGAAAADGAADIVGTAAYLDPVVAGGAAPGRASDVFAVAAVALHALTGRPAWPAESVSAAIALAARGEIPDLGERLSRAPASLRRVLERALCAEPFGRGTAAELALDLRHSVTPVPVELRGGRTHTGLERRPAIHIPRHSASAPLGSENGRGGLLTHAVRRPDPRPATAGRRRHRRPPRRRRPSMTVKVPTCCPSQ